MVEVAEVENLEFKWGKKRGIGGKKKDVQFYESFTYDGVEYTLYDCVYLYQEEEAEPFIGKLIKIWENADKTKKVKVLWFFRPSEISNFLGNDQTAENELFLACGEGVGLANINPLEAIAGKCNVLCTSKDGRNPQPSDEELQISDFIFYRTFDVGLRKVLDKIDEKIAGIEVKFIFNREGLQNSGGAMKLDLDRKEVGKNATARDETVISAQQKFPDSKASLVGKKPSLGENVTLREGAQMGGNMPSDKIRSSSKGELKKSNAKGNKVLDVKEGVKYSKDPGELDNRPPKKAKLDSSMKVSDDKIKNRVQKLDHVSDWHGAKPILANIDYEDKSKTKRAITKYPLGTERIPSKKPKLDELPTIGKLMEVTRRPNLDRSKWFKELPWEERIRTAHEQGKLVLLENLDPSYTSTEVEDIVWHAFKENCSAKMIQRIAFSSPHSGQAYVIFKTREVAEMVVSKLDEGCLLLSNGRPLLGSIGTPCFTGKQSTFVGHLVIDKLKPQMQREMSTFVGHLVIDKLKPQMQRVMREAVSTSHCSQPNTLEYDMAIDWSLLQERLDYAWKTLYEEQGQELKKLKAKFKSK